MYPYHYQFEKNARNNRRTALLLTIAFHALLLAAILYGNQPYLQERIPDTVKELLGMEMAPAEEIGVETPKP